MQRCYVRLRAELGDEELHRAVSTMQSVTAILKDERCLLYTSHLGIHGMGGTHPMDGALDLAAVGGIAVARLKVGGAAVSYTHLDVYKRQMPLKVWTVCELRILAHRSIILITKQGRFEGKRALLPFLY